MSRKKRAEKIDIGQQKTVPWISFENEVAEFFERSIPERQWGLDAKSAHVKRKPEYYSNSRKSNITFDISVEVHVPGNPTEIIFLWIIECKDYPNRNVKVDEVEEFHKKMEQVGAHKGIIFTRHGFASGAVEYAKTHRIGLSVLQKSEHVTIAMSQSGGAFFETDVMTPLFVDDDSESPTMLTHYIYKAMRPFDILVPPVSLAKRRITFDEAFTWTSLSESD